MAKTSILTQLCPARFKIFASQLKLGPRFAGPQKYKVRTARSSALTHETFRSLADGSDEPRQNIGIDFGVDAQLAAVG